MLVFHNSHIDGDNIKSSYKIALENSDKVAQYLLLTHMQKDDIQHAYSISDEKYRLYLTLLKAMDNKILMIKRIDSYLLVD